VIYTADSLKADPRVLLDPNTLSADGTVALGGGAYTDDGKLFAYGLATAGSDWQSGACATSRPARTCPTSSSG
jgi:prolyl oligopeptidase